MASEFDADCAVVQEDYFAVYGVTVTLRRGDQSQAMTAISEADSWEVESDDGGTVEFATRNYLILAADFLLGGEPTEPQRGDLIDETIGGQAATCELLTHQGQPCWSRVGPDSDCFYLRTKRVD